MFEHNRATTPQTWRNTGASSSSGRPRTRQHIMDREDSWFERGVKGRYPCRTGTTASKQRWGVCVDTSHPHTIQCWHLSPLFTLGSETENIFNHQQTKQVLLPQWLQCQRGALESTVTEWMKFPVSAKRKPLGRERRDVLRAKDVSSTLTWLVSEDQTGVTGRVVVGIKFSFSQSN